MTQSTQIFDPREFDSKIHGKHTRENSDVLNSMVKFFNSVPGAYIEKRHAGPGRKGKLDLTGSYHGRRVEIEVKAPGKKPTALQWKWIKHWTKMGAISGWCYDMNGFIEIFEALNYTEIRSYFNKLSKPKT